MSKTNKTPTMTMRPLNELFKSTDGSGGVKPLPISQLREYREHPFKLYEGKRFDDMVESVRAHGVIAPIIVRKLESEPNGSFEYEILSGHNRTAAAKAAGLDTIPAIVRDDLTDDEAALIVTETNLLQRSFSDLTHSERALALSAHYNALKHQGKRGDLIREIDTLTEFGGTFSPPEIKWSSHEAAGAADDLGKETVARYLRVNMLTDEIKRLLDS
jgi:ParB family chromosome partitioning protein